MNWIKIFFSLIWENITLMRVFQYICLSYPVFFYFITLSLKKRLGIRNVSRVFLEFFKGTFHWATKIGWKIYFDSLRLLVGFKMFQNVNLKIPSIFSEFLMHFETSSTKFHFNSNSYVK